MAVNQGPSTGSTPTTAEGSAASHATEDRETVSLGVAVLTVSDTRGPENDTSGTFLAEAAAAAGHRIVARELVRDDIYAIRAVLSGWIVDTGVNAVLVTGGTGFAGRDSTPEAVVPLFDKQVEGFGEVFRALSLQEIGSSTVQSRAVAGLANRTVVFCMPGSTGACRTAWEGVIRDQLDSAHRPCNFVEVLLGKTSA
ncbi:MAG: molybdenum cofactor biosynthesis protein B [Halieaceae bacterium]|jgi:molybdenum cofactor biosynthesis protein B|nr:molybdenum cofactor biosynthesis protein B [Halieaceae bacterium]